MRPSIQYALAAAPLALSLGGWKLAGFINNALGCNAIGKRPGACAVLGFDVQPFIGTLTWWGKLFWMPGLVISGLLVGGLVARRLPPPWGNRSGSGSREEPR